MLPSLSSTAADISSKAVGCQLFALTHTEAFTKSQRNGAIVGECLPGFTLQGSLKLNNRGT